MQVLEKQRPSVDGIMVTISQVCCEDNWENKGKMLIVAIASRIGMRVNVAAWLWR